MNDDPKVIPDSWDREQYIKEHADYFNVMYRYTRVGDYKTLEEARDVAKRASQVYKAPVMIYAVYGPYDTWVENVYSRSETTSEEGTKEKGTGEEKT